MTWRTRRAAGATWPERHALLLAAGAFAAFRLPELTRYPLWYDEVFSLTVVQGSWAELWHAAVADRTNPPLFYALLKAWVDVGGESVAWMRLLPCLLGMAVALPLAALAARIFSAPAGAPDGLAASRVAVAGTVAAAAASPLAVFLANELRGYSLLLLLSATFLVAFWRVVESAAWTSPGAGEGEVPTWTSQARGEHARRVVQLAAVATLLVYAHYFGWLVIAAQLAVAAVWHRPVLRAAWAATATAAVAFVPWTVAVLAAAGGSTAPLSNIAWIGKPGPGDVPLFYDALVARVLTPGLAWIGVVVLAGIGVGLWRSASGRAAAPWRSHLGPLAVFAVAPVAVAFAASYATAQAVFVPRYLIVVAPAWWVLMGAGIAGLAGLRPALRTGVAAAVVAFTLAAGTLRQARGGEKVDWASLIAAIQADAGAAGGTVYALEGFTALPAAFYARTLGTSLTVEPLRDWNSVSAPAWMVVRVPADPSAPALGAGLMPAGTTLVALRTDRIPSHGVAAYRLGPAPPR